MEKSYKKGKPNTRNTQENKGKLIASTPNYVVSFGLETQLECCMASRRCSICHQTRARSCRRRISSPKTLLPNEGNQTKRHSHLYKVCFYKIVCLVTYITNILCYFAVICTINYANKERIRVHQSI